MNKNNLFFYIFLLILPTFAYTEISSEKMKQYQHELLKGALAGAVSSLVIDFLRSYILADMSQYKLYDRFGICRNELTGQIKIATAAIGLYAATEPESKTSLNSYEKLTARIIGIFIGANDAVILRKYLFS